jgi:hypothetical protein
MAYFLIGSSPGRKAAGAPLPSQYTQCTRCPRHGNASLAAAVNRAFSSRLPRPVGQRAASDVLRRMLADGEFQLARDGKAFHEALYVRTRRKG